MALFWNEEFQFSFLLGFLLFEPQFRLQLRDVVVEILLGLFEQAEREEDFKMHEKWGKDERYPERHYIHFVIVNAWRRLTSK